MAKIKVRRSKRSKKKPPTKLEYSHLLNSEKVKKYKDKKRRSYNNMNYYYKKKSRNNTNKKGKKSRSQLKKSI